MGATETKEEQLPQYGFKVMNLQNQSSFELVPKLNIMTDYIISPDVSKLELTQQVIQLQVFSVLNYKTRIVNYPVKQNKLGISCKYLKISYCILKITSVFKNSPLANLGILVNEFIVGINQGQFESIKQFATLIKNLVQSNNQSITLGICNSLGYTRLVNLSIKQIKRWSSTYRKGYLGCELAEGLANKWKSNSETKNQIKKQTQNQTKSPLEKTKEQKKIQQIKKQDDKQKNNIQSTLLVKSIPKQDLKQSVNLKSVLQNKQILKQNMNNDDSFSSQQLNEKCTQLQMSSAKHCIARQKIWNIHKKENINHNILQISFKDDASTICRCRPYNKHCQKCFTQKDGNYYFFNKKTNRIILIQKGMLFPQKSSV